MTTYLCSSFSLKMLVALPARLVVEPLSDAEAAAIVAHAQQRGELVNTLGHEDTARRVSARLGRTFGATRAESRLQNGDCAVVAQYTGPRLPEGALELPAGATIQFMQVRYGE